MVNPEKRRIRKARIPSMRKPRRVLLSIGLCGLLVGLFLVAKTLRGGGEQFLMIGLVYILISFFLIGLGQALLGMSSVRKNSVKRKNVQ